MVCQALVQPDQVKFIISQTVKSPHLFQLKYPSLNAQIGTQGGLIVIIFLQRPERLWPRQPRQ